MPCIRISKPRRGSCRRWLRMAILPALPDFWTKYREEMVGRAGACIFLCGNKSDPGTGVTVVANGVLDEFEIARKGGRVVIPIGASGHAARAIWQTMMADLDTFFPQGGVKAHFQTLGNPRKSTSQILDAVFGILKHALC